MDVPKVCPDPETDPNFKLAIQWCIHYLSYMKSHVDPKRDFEFNSAASPGLGYSGTKGDAVKTDAFLKRVGNIDIIPVDVVNDKSEDLSMEDHERKKIRTVFSSQVDYVAKEDLVFGGQNDRLKRFYRSKYIKYGFVKQFGGFDEFLKEIQQFSLRAESDCSGWDRKIFLLYVYFIRRALLTNYIDYKEIADYIAFFNSHGTILLPDGRIYIRETGCNSGKRNTTSDNCIAHLLIMFYFFIERMEQLGIPKKITNIFQYSTMGLYSDDKLLSCDHEFWHFDVESFKAFEASVYIKFGLEIKPSQQLVTVGSPQEPIDPRHSFLGSFATFSDKYGKYMPSPREGKLCSSFVNELPKLENGLQFRRLMVLSSLLFNSPELFKEAIKFTQFFVDSNPEDSSLFISIMETHSLSLDTERDYLSLYLGLEGNHPSFNFFYGGTKSITHEIWKFEMCNGSANKWSNSSTINSKQSFESPQCSSTSCRPRWVARHDYS